LADSLSDDSVYIWLRDRLRHDHSDDGRRLASPPLGRFGSSAVFRVGVARNGAATIDHLDELGQVMIKQVSTIPLSVPIGVWQQSHLCNSLTG
jgi:hypothetical protein